MSVFDTLVNSPPYCGVPSGPTNFRLKWWSRYGSNDGTRRLSGVGRGIVVVAVVFVVVEVVDVVFVVQGCK